MPTISIPTDKASPQPQSSAAQAPVSPSTPSEAGAGGTFLPDAPEYQALKSKFNSPEALAKSYLELERRLGQPAGSPTVNETAPGDLASTAPTQAPPGALSQADFDALNAEYAQDGRLSDKSYQSLEQRGLGRQVVDTYIEGQRALQERQVGEVFAASGIKDLKEYQQLSDWADKSLPKDEVAAINRGLGDKDLGAVKVALTALKQRYSQANGQAPSLLSGKLASGPAVAPYTSSAQVTADMKKPEYKKDPAFREQVKARLAVSPNVLNNSIRHG